MKVAGKVEFSEVFCCSFLLENGTFSVQTWRNEFKALQSEMLACKRFLVSMFCLLCVLSCEYSPRDGGSGNFWYFGESA